MANKYSQFVETPYVPEYAPLPTRDIAQAGQQLQQRHDIYNEGRNRFDDTIEQELSSLPEHYRALIEPEVDNIRGSMEELAANGDLGEANDMIRRGSRDFSRKLAPFKQDVAARQQLNEDLDKSGQHKSVREFFQEQAGEGITRNEETGELEGTFQGGIHIPDYYSVPDVAKDATSSFASQKEADEFLRQSSDGSSIHRKVREFRDGNKVVSATVASILNDPKAVDQLSLELQAEGIDPNETVEVKDPNTEGKPREMSAIQAKALRHALPHGERLGFNKISYTNTRANPGAMGSGSSTPFGDITIPISVGKQAKNITPGDLDTRVSALSDSAENRLSSLRNFAEDNEIELIEGDNGELSFDESSASIRQSQLMEGYISGINNDRAEAERITNAMERVQNDLDFSLDDVPQDVQDMVERERMEFFKSRAGISDPSKDDRGVAPGSKGISSIKGGLNIAEYAKKHGISSQEAEEKILESEMRNPASVKKWNDRRNRILRGENSDYNEYLSAIEGEFGAGTEEDAKLVGVGNDDLKNYLGDVWNSTSKFNKVYDRRTGEERNVEDLPEEVEAHGIYRGDDGKVNGYFTLKNENGVEEDVRMELPPSATGLVHQLTGNANDIQRTMIYDQIKSIDGSSDFGQAGTVEIPISADTNGNTNGTIDVNISRLPATSDGAKEGYKYEYSFKVAGENGGEDETYTAYAQSAGSLVTDIQNYIRKIKP